MIFDLVCLLLAKDLPKEDKIGFKNVSRKAPDWIIDNITEASKNARSIYFLYLGLLAYCVLTVLSTDDRRLIVGQLVKLPIVNLEVDLDGFFLATPIIAILIYIYFQLYLYRLRSLISDLRIGYAPVEKRRLYPWMLNIAEEPDSGIVGNVQVGIVKLTVWWSLPIVLAMMNVRYVYKHNPTSYGLNLAPVISMSIVLFFWNLYENTKWQGYLRRNLGKCILVMMTLLYTAIMHWCVIPQAIQGNKVFSLFSLNINLSYQVLVTDSIYEAKYWANFKQVNLRGADLVNSNLKKANLQETKLERINFSFANLQETRLWDANLEKADLRRVNLEKADLRRANLRSTHLWRANLRKANLRDASLEKANLRRANLQEASFRDANLEKADLWRANLKEANLQGANLKEANLSDADLRGIKSWEADQLKSSFWDEKTKWPAEFTPPCLNHIPPRRCK